MLVPLVALAFPVVAMGADREEVRSVPVDEAMEALVVALQESAGETFGKMTPGDLAKTFLSMDPGTIPDHLLLAVLLSGATKGDPITAATRLLNLADQRIERVYESTIAKEAGIRPIGHARLLAATELSRRAQARQAAMTRTPITTARESYEILRTLSLGPVEALSALYLDRKLRLLGIRTLTIGSENFTVVDPKQVLRPGLELGAYALVLAHNHPSGDPVPSVQDREVTRKVEAAGRVLGIKVLDHIVIGADRFSSLAEMGEISGYEAGPLWIASP